MRQRVASQSPCCQTSFFFFPKRSEDLTVTLNRSRCVCIHNTGKNFSSLRASESLIYCFTVNQITATSTTVSHMLLLSLVTPLWKLCIFGAHCLPERMPERCQRTCEIENGAGGEGEGGVFTFEYFLALCGMTVFFHLTLHTTASRLWRFAAG